MYSLWPSKLPFFPFGPLIKFCRPIGLKFPTYWCRQPMRKLPKFHGGPINIGWLVALVRRRGAHLPHLISAVHWWRHSGIQDAFLSQRYRYIHRPESVQKFCPSTQDLIWMFLPGPSLLLHSKLGLWTMSKELSLLLLPGKFVLTLEFEGSLTLWWWELLRRGSITVGSWVLMSWGRLGEKVPGL